MSCEDMCRLVEVKGVLSRIRGSGRMDAADFDVLAEMVLGARHLFGLRACPECHAGSHRNCRDVTWCEDHDDFAPCPCALTGHRPSAGAD